MRNRTAPPLMSARALALLGAALLACQSAPSTSKEPTSKEPASNEPASNEPATSKPPAASAPAAAAAAPRDEATQPLQGSTPAASAGVKLTGSAPAQAAAAPAAAPAQAEVAAPPAQAAADKAAPKAPADKAGAAKGSGEKVAEAKAPAAKTVQGAVVNEEPFSTWLQVTSPAKAGEPAQVEAVLVAKAPYHCNAEYPHKFKLNAAPAGLSYPEETVRGMKVTPERGVLTIPVNTQSAGKPTVTGTLSFSVCTEERCLVEKRDLSVPLDVM